MDLTVKLQVFEGPLDLLLHLLEKNKVNIYDIPIVEITSQYMDYINEMQTSVPPKTLLLFQFCRTWNEWGLSCPPVFS